MEQLGLTATEMRRGLEGTCARRVPACKSMLWPSIPMLYPCHAELGVPFSQLQKHNSFVHDWKKWWGGIVMTILTSLILCLLLWALK